MSDRFLARALLQTALAGMRDAGLERGFISTGNEVARKLYESVGFIIVQKSQEYSIKAVDLAKTGKS